MNSKPNVNQCKPNKIKTTLTFRQGTLHNKIKKDLLNPSVLCSDANTNLLRQGVDLGHIWTVRAFCALDPSTDSLDTHEPSYGNVEQRQRNFLKYVYSSRNEEMEEFSHEIDFALLLKGSCEADVVLKIENKHFKCHKSILCRFEYFEKLLCGRWKEDELDDIHLNYISLECFTFVLLFMYSGITVVPERVDLIELLHISEIYDIPNLRCVALLHIKAYLCHFFDQPCDICTTGIIRTLKLCQEFSSLGELRGECHDWLSKNYCASALDFVPDNFTDHWKRSVNCDPDRIEYILNLEQKCVHRVTFFTETGIHMGVEYSIREFTGIYPLYCKSMEGIHESIHLHKYPTQKNFLTCIYSLGKKENIEFQYEMDFSILFNDSVPSDVTFKVKDKQLKCHRFILQRCEYFASMFSGNWREEKQREIEINDFSAASFCIFLLFVYLNICNIPEEVDVDELLHLSEIYNVEGFTKAVILHIKANLCHFFGEPCERCIRGVNGMLEFCRVFSLLNTSLRKECFDWLTRHYGSIFTKSRFSKLSDELNDLREKMKQELLL